MQKCRHPSGKHGKQQRVSISSSHGNLFTMIELMIVISIIAVLVSLLLPALAKVRGKAQSIQCMQNQKTLSLAMHYYMDSFNGWGRIYLSGTDENAVKDNYYATRYFFGPITSSRFSQTLLPYVDNGKNYVVDNDPELKYHDAAPFAVCPGGRRDGSGITAPNDGNMPNFSYSFNSHLCFSQARIGSNGYNRMSSVRRPSGRILLADFSCVKNDGTTTYSYRAMHLMAQGNISRRHNNYGNIAFVDGHVESWSSTRISTLHQASAYTHPNVGYWADYN
ncbi:MAG: prepilin-type N-terminal cleavage/methylation domain-containing protein [Victivallales bacterium]